MFVMPLLHALARYLQYTAENDASPQPITSRQATACLALFQRVVNASPYSLANRSLPLFAQGGTQTYRSFRCNSLAARHPTGCLPQTVSGIYQYLRFAHFQNQTTNVVSLSSPLGESRSGGAVR